MVAGVGHDDQRLRPASPPQLIIPIRFACISQLLAQHLQVDIARVRLDGADQLDQPRSHAAQQFAAPASHRAAVRRDFAVERHHQSPPNAGRLVAVAEAIVPVRTATAEPLLRIAGRLEAVLKRPRG